MRRTMQRFARVDWVPEAAASPWYPLGGAPVPEDDEVREARRVRGYRLYVEGLRRAVADSAPASEQASARAGGVRTDRCRR